MSEYEPGTVIGALLDGIEIVGIVRGGGRHVFYADSVTTDQVAIKHLADVRPLVVIDPEDREQVERLWRCWTNLAPDHRLAQDNMQAALREFANPTPPKPPEPTGLGAVVEDAEGRRWVRNPDPGVICKWRDAERRWRNYGAIDAVRVLSEGVSDV